MSRTPRMMRFAILRYPPRRLAVSLSVKITPPRKGGTNNAEIPDGIIPALRPRLDVIALPTALHVALAVGAAAILETVLFLGAFDVNGLVELLQLPFPHRRWPEGERERLPVILIVEEIQAHDFL